MNLAAGRTRSDLVGSIAKWVVTTFVVLAYAVAVHAQPAADAPPAPTAAPATQPESQPEQQQPKLRPAVAYVTISQIPLAHPHATPAQYRQLYLNEARTVAFNCRRMHACAAIVWDESCDDLQPWKYIGDPRLQHESFAPVAKEFFDTIRAAGVEVGVTLRWEALIRDFTGELVPVYPASPTISLITKAVWAKEHYGCTWAYVDSNTDDHGVLDVRPLLMLQTKMPGFTWWMEQTAPAQDGVPRGWARDDYKRFGRWCDARFENPIPDDGFRKLIGGPDKPDESRFAEFVAAARRGDKILFNAWGAVDARSNPFADFVRQVCEAANR
jgi:hypothetical protein